MSAAASQSIIDYLGAAEVAIVAFFVVLAIVLLARYKEASERISASSELGRDLWRVLEDRLKKQDEKIVDLLARLEILQARVTAGKLQMQPQALHDATISQPQAPAPRPLVGMRLAAEPETPVPATTDLIASEKAALKFLERGTRSTNEIRVMLDRSREHTARLMKGLYDRGLVERDQSQKPFVYRLTEAGKKYLA